MAQEQGANPKPQLKCRDCSVDIDKLLEVAGDVSDDTDEHTSPRPAVVFDLSLMGGGPVRSPEDGENGSDSAD